MSSSTRDSLVPKETCSVIKYLERYDPALYEVIDALCLKELFDVKKYKNGFTFLRPTKENVRKDFIDDAFRGKADEAYATLKSLIIPVALHNKRDFYNMRADIPNLHGKRLEVTAPNPDKIRICGVEIRKNSEFETPKFRKEENDKSCIWDWEGIPQQGGQDSRHKGNNGKKGGAVGGCDTCVTGGGSSDRSRLALAAECEAHARENNNKQCYLDQVASLLAWLHKENPEECCKVVCLLDYCPMTSFYLIFEPGMKGGHHVLSDELFNNWYKNRVLQPCPVKAYLHMLNKLEDNLNGGALATSAGRVAIKGAIDKAVDGCKPGILLPGSIGGVYESLEKRNQISDVKDVLPPACHEMFKSNPGLKCFQDEFRTFIHQAALDGGLDGAIHMAKGRMAGGIRARICDDVKYFRSIVGGSDVYDSGPAALVACHNFLYVPFTPSEVEKLGDDNAYKGMKAHKEELENMEKNTDSRRYEALKNALAFADEVGQC